MVVASNVTSAAVDGYVAGRPVLSFLDPVRLNTSPLRELEGAVMFETASHLAQLLRDTEDLYATAGRVAFFCLDSRLPRWSSLLAVPA